MWSGGWRSTGYCRPRRIQAAFIPNRLAPSMSAIGIVPDEHDLLGTREFGRLHGIAKYPRVWFGIASLLGDDDERRELVQVRRPAFAVLVPRPVCDDAPPHLSVVEIGKESIPHFPDEPRGRVVIGKKATYLSRIREHPGW